MPRGTCCFDLGSFQMQATSRNCTTPPWLWATQQPSRMTVTYPPLRTTTGLWGCRWACSLRHPPSPSPLLRPSIPPPQLKMITLSPSKASGNFGGRHEGLRFFPTHSGPISVTIKSHFPNLKHGLDTICSVVFVSCYGMLPSVHCNGSKRMF